MHDRVDSLDLTIDVGDLIEHEQRSSNLAVAARIVTKKAVNVEGRLGVHRKNWTRAGGLDLKETDKWTFIFNFEDTNELELVLKKVPWRFDISLMVIQKLE